MDTPDKPLIQNVRLWSIPSKLAYDLGQALIERAEETSRRYLDEHRGATVEQAQQLSKVIMGDDYRLPQLGTRVRSEAKADHGIPMRLPCPACGKLHIDEGEFATKAHHTHACQFCGMVWRPAVVATVGVGFLPGFKN